MVSLFYARRYPAGREFRPDDQSGPNDTRAMDVVPDPSPNSGDPPPTTPTEIHPPPEPPTVPDQNLIKRDQQPPVDNGPIPISSGSLDLGAQEFVVVSSSPQPTATDYFIPSSALNNPQPTITQTLGTDATPLPQPPVSSLTVVSTDNLPTPSTFTLSTDTLLPTPTPVLTQGGALSTGSSSKKKYIIGGAVGGGVLVLILLALLLFCCRKRRARRDPERPDVGHSEGQPGFGQFACCSHGTCHKNNGQPQMEQKTPLKPFILKSDPAALTPKQGRQQHVVSLNRRDSTESQKSAESETSSAYSSDSGRSQPGRRRSQKRPPPLKLTSLVTPIINGPQHNPRHRVDGSSLPNPHGVPAIIVEPPQSETPDRMRHR